MAPLHLSANALSRDLDVPPNRITAIIAPDHLRAVTADTALRLHCNERPYAVALGPGRPVRARSIVIATRPDYAPPASENRCGCVGRASCAPATHP